MIKIILIVGVIASIYLVQSKPWEPEPRTEQWWIDRHNAFVNNSRDNGTNIKIVFTGSSSIEYWSTTGEEIWNAKYAPLGAVNYGIGGDQIQHCLWRIMNGEVEKLNPKMLVLYCGSNNIGNPSNDEIIRGITETLDEIRRRLPATKILYMNINPRGDIQPVQQLFNRTVDINQQIIQINQGKNVTIFDMFDDLIQSWENGTIKTELYQSDKLHLNKAGYVQWDALWNSTFLNLYNS